ncbi:class I SAM-dependent methyltransferase [Pandoraea apista]|uniref:class I SAM-dependent methyltransferase n=1 Tax=Pandoraea apista TaxID=93218 RepID=UPI0006588584|nr:class I SAM-dependent methyltransferase [Pandoraea apista]ALS64544.1 methyltransferase [Pandoraea apista]RRW97436.1 class I SAM-dependent methyltransferase [Pandoraea apista]RRW99249.1 class I SAM-dependent methyltransferase [Pandoraea apista]CFB64447.1 Ubiquinone biosynthesis O-methyltransferase [Pandoraea apista]
MQSKDHWNQVYSTKAPTHVSWFQEHANQSVELIAQAQIEKGAEIIDVGGGASTLVDDLLSRGYRHLTVLDLSDAALAVARDRLGAGGDSVSWIADDITRVELPVHQYDVWHDRAVFHFLTSDADRHAYVSAVLRAVKPGGLVIVATFAEDGPEQCSGLPVMRYSPDALHAEFGAPFTLLRKAREEHQTPWGATQKFIYCLCRKDAD